MATNMSLSDDNAMSWPAQHSLWSKCFEAFCKTIFKLYCPLTTFGRENLPPTPFLICSNHASHLDGVLLITAANLSFQEAGLIAAKDYFFDQSHRLYLHHMMNLVPIARRSGAGAIKDSLNACRSFLGHGGKALIIFPEGTRAKNGDMARFKDGAALLAHDLDIPMVPAYIRGTSASLPKGSYFIRPQHLSVSFGPAVKVNFCGEVADEDGRKMRLEAIRQATLEVQERVRALQASLPSLAT
jgi:1-acyl-sn-glycerol-3-phosphate acyltransferase